MSLVVTEQILLAVKNAKDSAECAEAKFDKESERLQSKTEQTIKLFGENAVGQLSDIITQSRKICDELYATYQMLVKVLDEECRPLLDQNPEYRAILAVRNQINTLNDESEIENNFTASLNSYNLGDVAAVRYIPSVECKMIQSYWEAKCNSNPGKTEYEEKEQKIEAKINEYSNNIKYANQKIIDNYKKERDEWVAECDRINSAHNADVQKQINNIKSELMRCAEKKFEETCCVYQSEKQKYTQIKSDAEATLATLGLFKFEEKKTQKGIIENAIRMINKINIQMKSAKEQYDSEVASATQKAERQRCFIAEKLKDEYQLPPRPVVPHIEGLKNANDFYQQSILEGLQKDKLYSVTDIMKEIVELSGLAQVRVLSFLRTMVAEGVIVKIEENRQAFFKLR